MLEESVTLPPPQKLVGPLAEIVGAVAVVLTTVTETESKLGQPPVLVTVI